MAFVPPARHLVRARDLADARYVDPLGVDDLARAAGLSPFYFSRMFKATTGTTPHERLMDLRIESAARLLERTKLALSEIATRSGFRTQAHFSAAFRRRKGCTPREWRRNSVAA